MQARTVIALGAAVLVATACGSSGIPDPRPTSVQPGRGFVANATPVVIRGEAFVVRTIQPVTGGATTVDSTYRAWLGDRELQSVTRVDEKTLTATVPAGLVPGAKVLRVESPFGRRGQLSNAYVVEGAPLAVLGASIAAAPAKVSVGQAVTVTVTVTNTGTVPATNITMAVPTVTGTGLVASGPTGPTPASIPSLDPDASGTFTWTFVPTAAGDLAFAATVTGTDSFSGAQVSGATDPKTPARVVVQRPATLAATLTVPTTVPLGSDFAVTMTVSNSGDAAALGVTPSDLAPTPASVSVGLRSRPSPGTVDVPGATGTTPGTATFTWVLTAGSTSGPYQVSGSAEGADANSLSPVTAPTVSSNVATVGRAGLGASAVAPSTVSVGQTFTITLTVTNPGTAAVTNVQPGIPSVTTGSGAGASLASGPTPASIASLAVGATGVFTWSYVATSPGQLSFLLTPTGTDSFSGATVGNSASVPVAVQAPAVLTATLVADRATANTNQPITLNLTLRNTGVATATVSAVTPSVTPATAASCAAPTPALPQSIPGGAVQTFTWTCTATTAGARTLGATIAATDANSAANVAPAVTAVPVTIQAPAGLTATFVASRATAALNQAVTVTLTLANAAGAAAANVTSVTPTVSPATGMTCTAAAPVPVTIAGGATAPAITWTCTGTVAGAYTLGATVVATDANSGSSVAPTLTAIPVTVQGAGALTATFVASRATAALNQAVTVTLTLTNPAGNGTANVASVTPTVSPATGMTCTVAAPVPATIAGNPTTPTTAPAITWTCTGTVAGAYTLGATVVATNANNGSSVAPTLTAIPVTVQGSGLTATFVASRATAALNQAVTVTLTLTNPVGNGTANVASVTPTVSPATGMTCTAAAPVPVTIAGGTTAPAITWNCTGTVAGAYTLGATVVATDANSGSSVAPTLTAIPVTVQGAGALTATFVASRATAALNQAVTVTLTLTNPAGNGTANVASVTPTVSPATGMTCTVAAPVPATIAGGTTAPAITWTCTGTVAGAYTLGATVVATNANNGSSVAPTLTAIPVTVQPLPVLTAASFTADRTTAAVNQAVTVSLTLANAAGSATANVASVTPTVSPAGMTCTAAASVPATIAGGTTTAPPTTWTCTATATGVYTLGATVASTDANNGASVASPTLPVRTVTVQSPPNLQPSLVASLPVTGFLTLGQAVTFTYTVSNIGAATANIASMASSVLIGTSTPACTQPAPVPASIVGVTGVATATFTCTPATASLTVNASLVGSDANNGSPTSSASASASVTAQTPPALTVSAFTVPATSGGVGSTITVSMTVVNSGQAAASGVTPVALSPASGNVGTATLASGPLPASATIAGGGGSQTFNWTYTVTATGTFALDANVGGHAANGTDANSGAAVFAPAATSTTGTLSLAAMGPGAADSTALAAAPAAEEATLVAEDPLGDGMPTAFVNGWQGSVWVGPGRDGRSLARLDAAGRGTAGVVGLAVGVDRGATPASGAAWVATPSASTLGSAGCSPGTAACGPDGEAGAAVVVAGSMGGAERLVLAGLGPSGSRFLYAALSGADPLDLGWVDLSAPLDALGGSATSPSLTAALFTSGAGDRLYLGYAGQGVGPLVLALVGPPGGAGLDAIAGVDVIDLGIRSMPGAVGSSGTTALAEAGGALYVAHDGGLVRSTVPSPSSYAASPADWALATPSAAEWSAKAAVTLPASSPVARRDRAVPALAAFGTCGGGPCVFAARNVLGTATQPPVVPQLWQCSPSAGPGQCDPGDWWLAVPNAAGDSMLTQLGAETNGAVTVLEATPRWLYLGFDNASTGIQLYRAGAPPGTLSGFKGSGGCAAGTPGCQGLGGDGFGRPRNTRVLDARAITVAGQTALWLIVGDGAGPVSVYRIAD